MIREADVVVIGSGGLGAATAFYLAKRGDKNVALLDKHEIGSQTSPRAAGMVSCVRKGDLMISLIKLACERIRSFSKDTGQPLNWVHSGSLKIARRPQDAEVIASDVARGPAYGAGGGTDFARRGTSTEPIPPIRRHSRSDARGRRYLF